MRDRTSTPSWARGSRTRGRRLRRDRLDALILVTSSNRKCAPCAQRVRPRAGRTYEPAELYRAVTAISVWFVQTFDVAFSRGCPVRARAASSRRPAVVRVDVSPTIVGQARISSRLQAKSPGTTPNDTDVRRPVLATKTSRPLARRLQHPAPRVARQHEERLVATPASCAPMSSITPR